MKYKDKELDNSTRNDVVTGKNNKYECWSFGYRNIYDSNECQKVVCVTSFISPISNNRNEILNFKRNYLSVNYYDDFEDYKSENHQGFVPTHVFIIPVNGIDKEFIDIIIRDISDKHDL
ncbi:hypothetical protein [Aquimarina latercula]|uniref:hypothetical protein n=1 Tax=Aquimarina latercula TaxID=987 RepID=UPI0004028133|nr:hypothetical protein [Aquimarina latercula]